MGLESLPQGTKLGRWRTVALLGRGGMGAVYRAVDDRGVEVALKVVLSTLAQDERLRQRFEREGRTASRIAHPNVARVVETGEERGVAFIASELLTGGTLKALVTQRGRLPWLEAVRFAIPIARALEAVHGAGLVHRDLKPENVLLDAAGVPKLADFGLVRRTKTGGATLSGPLTAAGETLGTPEYCAPEQADGAHELDGRADLYALGATIFALVSGRPPFTGVGYALLKQVLMEPAPRLRTVAPEVPPALDALVAGLLQKDPAKRPANAAEVAFALEALVAGGPASKARPPSSRGRLVAVVAGLVAVAAASGGVFELISRPAPAPPVAPGPPVAPPVPVKPPAPPPIPPPVAPTTPLVAPPPPGARRPRPVPTTGRVSLLRTLGELDWHHQIAVKSIAFAPDGTRVISGGDDWWVRVWDPKGIETAWHGSPGMVWRVSVSPGGRRALATGGPPCRIFDGATMTASPRPLAVEGDTTTAAEFVGEDRVLVGYESGQLRLWDIASEAVIERAPAHQARVVSIAVSRDAKTIYSADRSGVIHRWKGGGLDPDGTLGEGAADGELGMIALSRDDTVLASTRAEGVIRLHGTGQGPKRPPMPHRGVAVIAFSPDGKALFSAGGDRIVRRWEWPTRVVARASARLNVIEALAVSPDSKRLMIGGWDGSLEPLDAATLADERPSDLEHTSWIEGVAWLDDSKRLVSVGDGKALLWDVETGRAVNLATREKRLNAVAVHGRSAFVGGDEGGLARLDLDRPGESELVMNVVKDGSQKVWSLDVSRDGARVTGAMHVGGPRDYVYVMEVGGQKSGGKVDVQTTRAAFVGRGERIAFVADAMLQVWDGERGHKPRAFPDPERFRALAPLDADDRVLAATFGGGLAVRDLRDGSVVGTPLDKVPFAAWAIRDHLKLATSRREWAAAIAWNEKPRIWDLATGRIAGTVDLEPTTDCAWSLAFSPDERRLAIGTRRGVIHVFTLGEEPK